jgi:hypothetical protein
MDKHHIVPRYMGGSDDYTNLVYVNRTRHMMFHFTNYQLWGNTEDYVAYRGLSGQVDKQGIIKELCSMNGKRCYEEGKGMFSLSKEEKAEASARGGKKAGKYMSKSIWITTGTHNKRILKIDPIPDGYRLGKTNINQVKKVNTRGRSWEEFIADKRSCYELRREYLDKIEDLNKYGIRTAIAKEWGVSRTQVNRFIAQHYTST